MTLKFYILQILQLWKRVETKSQKDSGEKLVGALFAPLHPE